MIIFWLIVGFPTLVVLRDIEKMISTTYPVPLSRKGPFLCNLKQDVSRFKWRNADDHTNRWGAHWMVCLFGAYFSFYLSGQVKIDFENTSLSYVASQALLWLAICYAAQTIIWLKYGPKLISQARTSRVWPSKLFLKGQQPLNSHLAKVAVASAISTVLINVLVQTH
jgi:hypothetical protein